METGPQFDTVRGEIERTIDRMFVSREDPRYAWKEAVIDAAPYADLLRDLAEAGIEVVDDTDFEESVSYVWSLRRAGEEICLWLSIVGRYVMVTDGPWLVSGPVLDPPAMTTPLRRAVARLLDAQGIVQLAAAVLAEQTRFRFVYDDPDTGRAPLYRVMFYENLESLPGTLPRD